MPEQQFPAAITVTEMAEMIGLSRSRFYALIESGIVPPPVRVESAKRPVYVRELIAGVLEIKRTGVGANGSLVTFNRKRKNCKDVRATTRKVAVPIPDSGNTEIATGLQSLGLDVTEPQVTALMAEHFPNSTDTEVGEIIRRLFLVLQRQE